MKSFIVDLSNGDKFGPYDAPVVAMSKAQSSGLKTAVIDENNNVLCGYTVYGARIEPKGNKKLQEIL